ncbi:MAG: hypothetical protein AAF266_12945 [Planctomycetota bacterium]
MVGRLAALQVKFTSLETRHFDRLELARIQGDFRHLRPRQGGTSSPAKA